MSPDFHNTYNTKDFPAKDIFNYDQWRKDKNYMAIVKPEENVDSFGNKDNYELDEKFQLIILLDYNDDENT